MRSSLRAARVCVSLAWRSGRADFAGLIAMSVIGAVYLPLSTLWLRALTNAVVSGRAPDAVRWGMAYGAATGLVALIFQRRWYFTQRVRDRSAIAIDRYLNELTAGLPGIEHHERPEFLDRLGLIHGDKAVLADNVPVMTSGLFLSVRFAFTAALLASLHPALLGLVLLALPSLATAGWGRHLQQQAQERTVERSTRLGGHLFALITQPTLSKELWIFGSGAEVARRDRHLWDDVTAIQGRATAASAGLAAVGALLFGLGYVGAVALVAVRVARGAASLGDLTLAVTLAAQVNGQVQEGANTAVSVQSTRVALQRFGWLLDYRDAAAAAQTHEPPTAVPDAIVEDLAICDLSFRYPGTDIDVLSGITLTIPAGTSLAVVGDNGAGKSTLIKLLCRLYEPTSGSIRLDGVDIRRFDAAEWRRRLTAAFQDVARLELVVRETVGVGDIERLSEPGAVEDALARAGATDLATMIDGGLDAQLGKAWSGGIEISGGQWQKLGLGRAMMRRAPLVLILDEPTSALDAQSEHDLFQRQAVAARDSGGRNGAITILVSHRFSTVTTADQIAVIDDGRLIELGTHAALLAAGGLYAELFSIQANAYR